MSGHSPKSPAPAKICFQTLLKIARSGTPVPADIVAHAKAGRAPMNDMRVAAENPPAPPAGWRGRTRRLEEHDASNHETSNDGAYDS